MGHEDDVYLNGRRILAEDLANACYEIGRCHKKGRIVWRNRIIHALARQMGVGCSTVTPKMGDEA